MALSEKIGHLRVKETVAVIASENKSDQPGMLKCLI